MGEIVSYVKIWDGVKKEYEYKNYDYNFLGNLPWHAQLIICQNGQGPPLPGADQRGNIAIISYTDRREGYPAICLRRNGQYQWVPFGRPRHALTKPFINFFIEKLVAPHIYYSTNDLLAPEIFGEIDKLFTPVIKFVRDKLGSPIIERYGTLDAPDIGIFIDQLGRPQIRFIADKLRAPEISLLMKLDAPEIGFLMEKLDTPIINLVRDDPQPDLHAAILGQAILGSCYLGGGESDSTLGTFILGKGKLGADE